MRVVLQEISKTFEDGNPPVAALSRTSLTIASGEFICLIGPSGCGKSTLLRMLAGQIPASSGSIRLDNLTTNAARTCKAIAWMAQNPALLPWQTVIENVQLPRRINRRHQRPAPAPRDLLTMVGLKDFTDAYPKTLSGGMQQRVALARTLTIGAELWLMDEPFAALDELTRERLTEEVLLLWQKFHPTVVWVTHNITEALRMADRIVILTQRPGQIKAIVPITLPRPRDETTAGAIDIIRKLRALLRAES